ncbi:DNA-formamidopyrimidine glycosylase [Anaerolineales bacterium]
MPELPEVETVVRAIRPALINRQICAFWYDWEMVFNHVPARMIEDQIMQQEILGVSRRAKYIVIQLTHDYLVIHLKMTGRLYVCPAEEIHDADKWVHFKLGLNDGNELRFSDPRKFGKVYLMTTLESLEAKLGPEPLEDAFSLEIFLERIKGYKRKIKPLLLDQGFIAGVGNIYADEALNRAHIHPERLANTLNPEELENLYLMIRQVLQDGIAYEGASVSWYRKPDGTKGESQNHFYAYNQEGKPCRFCGHPIEKIRVAQRGTHYCPHCQI